MNDTRIWSAAQMRVLFPHKKTKCVHHLQAEDALKRGCVKCTIGMRFRCAFNVTITVITGDSLPPISLQQLPVIIPFQYLHLLDGNLVEFYQALTLRHSVIDENGIDVLHIREADEFVDGSIVANITL